MATTPGNEYQYQDNKYERNQPEASSDQHTEGGRVKEAGTHFPSEMKAHRIHGPAPATSTELLTHLTHASPSCKGMQKDNVFSFKGIWSRTFSIKKKRITIIIIIGGSHKQEHAGTQT